MGIGDVPREPRTAGGGGRAGVPARPATAPRRIGLHPHRVLVVAALAPYSDHRK